MSARPTGMVTRFFRAPMQRTFEYEALDGSGRALSGRLAATHDREALRLLQAQSLIPVSLRLLAETEGAVRKSFMARPPSVQDRTLTLKQLALLLNAGVPLVQSVSTLKAQNLHPELGEAFGGVERRLRSGDTFVTALQAALPELPAYVFQLAAAGEAIGRLGKALDDGAKQMEYEHQVRVNIRNALTYPTILMISGITAVLFIFIVVVPRFSSMVANAKTPLPLLSRVVINTGTFLNAHLNVVLLLAVALGASIAWATRNPAMRLRLRENVARLPLIGKWLQEADLATWASMLATMLENGVDLIKGLQLARDSVNLPVLARKLDQVSKLVRGGQPLSQSLASQGLFNSTAVSLIQVGEESGEMPTMLLSLATLYEELGRQRMKRFLLLLEPIAILSIGGIIGLIVAAIMLAITSVNQLAI